MLYSPSLSCTCASDVAPSVLPGITYLTHSLIHSIDPVIFHYMLAILTIIFLPSYETRHSLRDTQGLFGGAPFTVDGVPATNLAGIQGFGQVNFRGLEQGTIRAYLFARRILCLFIALPVLPIPPIHYYFVWSLPFHTLSLSLTYFFITSCLPSLRHHAFLSQRQYWRRPRWIQ